MATLRPYADGTFQALLSAAEEAMAATPPDGTGTPLVFDEESNAALVADLRASTDAYRLSGGALTKNGAAVAIAADSPETTFRRQLAALIQGQRDYLALASPTNAQNTAANQGQAKLLLLLARVLQRQGAL